MTKSNSDCPTCKGAGFLRHDVPYTDPLFGKPVPCPTCHDGELARRLGEMSQLSGTLRAVRLSDFDVRPGTEEAFVAIRDYVHEPRGFLTIWGGYGCGKTHLLAALVNECTAEATGAVYYTLPDLVEVFREAVAANAYSRRYTQVLSVHVLVIDEIDKVRLTEWAREQLFRLVDERYRMRHQRGTVFAMNVQPMLGDEELGYLYSRMHDGRIIYNTASDMRPVAGSLWHGLE